MSITLMSQATGGRSIVIEANHNIVLSQEKMPNGTVQFIIKTDTKSTTPETTTPVSTTVPTEEPELDGEETTTTPIPTTTALSSFLQNTLITTALMNKGISWS
jgi:hypothetical protein